MPRRRIHMLLLVACVLATPGAARAADPAPDTGGTSMPATDPALSATGHVLVGQVATFRGSLPADAGKVVTIERHDVVTGAWIPVARATIAADGAYEAEWEADVAGRLRTRANVERRAGDGASLALVAPHETSLTVYRPATASWFGPGFYGRRTACGRRMTRRLLGVAHKKLPCGTDVAIAYEGSTITVPVVDRGPFKRGRRWDLTAATAKALGFAATDRIGAVRVDQPRSASR
jgi:rare lipoprotein A